MYVLSKYIVSIPKCLEIMNLLLAMIILAVMCGAPTLVGALLVSVTLALLGMESLALVRGSSYIIFHQRKTVHMV